MSEIRNNSIASLPFYNLLTAVAASTRIAKVPLCLLIACSTGFGSSLAFASNFSKILPVSCGVLLLAMGAATLNSLQEIKVDSCMQRTKNRPLVRGELSKRFAVGQAALLLCCGLATVLLTSKSLAAPALALLALVFYNGLYTPLKKVTLYALIPGAICGAIPPLIGLSAMGEELASHQALLLAALLVLWQIPHFFLVQLKHRGDYLTSIHPNFLRQFSEQGLRKIAVVWVSSLGFVMILFTVSEVVESLAQCYLIVANSLVFTFTISRHLLSDKSRNYHLLFISLNCMLLTHMLILSF